MEEPGRLQSMGLLRVGYNWTTSLSLSTFMHWRRKWQPTPVFLPGESQGRGSLWAAVYGVAQSWTQLKWLSSSSSAVSATDSWWTTESPWHVTQAAGQCVPQSEAIAETFLVLSPAQILQPSNSSNKWVRALSLNVADVVFRIQRCLPRTAPLS